MCVIIHLEAQATICEKALTNAVYNNPHGWGIIVFGEEYQDGIYVDRDVPESGETNPEDIIKLLKQYEDKERLLHLRWATVGKVNLENSHPFLSYEDENGNEVWFMHNGTLGGYGSDSNGWYGYFDHLEHDWIDSDDVSDSRDFNAQVLQPYLDRWDGDYHDWHFQHLVEAFWVGGSRGVLVSNYAKPWFFGGKWEMLDPNQSTGEVKISNDSYFDKVIRGPELERRRAALAKERNARKKPKKNGKKATGFLEVIPWDEVQNPTVNFDRLSKTFGDAHFEVAPKEVFNIIRALSNDEVGQLLVAEFLSIRDGDFEPESSLAFNLIMAYAHYFQLFIEEAEDRAGKSAEEIIDARKVA